MKIAIYIAENNNREIGGGFSYMNTLLKTVDSYDFNNQIEIVYITKYFNPKSTFKKNTIYYGSLIRKKKWTNYFKFNSKKIVTEEMAMIDQLIKNNIDLLYYPQAETFVLDYPYIMTSWDLGHRSTYSFPEMSMNDTFELRNSFRVNALLKSTAIIVESEESKEELIKYTQVYDKKIFVLPLPYGSVVNQNPSEFESEIYLKTNKLSANNYFLYPAQFWSHKNHYNLILAFNNYLKQYKDTKLILTGSDKGNLSYIKELVKDLQLEKHIVFAGYVSDLELNILYRNAISLVFPSLLGPTNMPLLEALKIGCKVICSNLVGHMKLMGENALYFNPLDPDDISNKMIKIKTLEISTSIELQNFGEKLENIFLQIIPFRMTFGRNFDQY